MIGRKTSEKNRKKQIDILKNNLHKLIIKQKEKTKRKILKNKKVIKEIK